MELQSKEAESKLEPNAEDEHVTAEAEELEDDAAEAALLAEEQSKDEEGAALEASAEVADEQSLDEQSLDENSLDEQSREEQWADEPSLDVVAHALSLVPRSAAALSAKKGCFSAALAVSRALGVQ